MSSEEKRGKIDHDTPPFSRLFVICSKNHDENDVMNAFGKYGNIQDVWMVKDRNTGDRKGICYIKFKKASEAHIAMEHLHGETIGEDSKPLKVLLADSKGQSRSGSQGDTKPRSRIFILVSKSVKSDELEEDFSKFGEVENVQILTDKTTGDSKGCAYVKFDKPSSAFQALEECNERYKAVIAEPRVPRDKVSRTEQRGGDRYDKPYNNFSSDYRPVSGGFSSEYPSAMETISYTDMTDPGAMQRLYIVCHTSLYEEQLFSLFDLVPGLEHFELKMYRGSNESRGFGYAQYSTLELACYAKRKLDSLEYPPGHKLIVKYAEQRPIRDGEQPMDFTPSGRVRKPSDTWKSANNPSNIRITVPSHQPVVAPESVECPYTDVSLPKPQQRAPPGSACRAKLFVVSSPNNPDERALYDVFGRFASLIDIQLLPGTSYGYIRYGMKESAEAAKMVMNNATISGCTVRLSHCNDDNPDNNPKRSRKSFDGYQQYN